MLTPDERGQVEVIMRQLRQRHDAIDAHPTASPQDKRARKARAQLAAEKAHRAIIDASDARHARESRDRYYKCFGLKANGGTDLLADRDARAFAARLASPADALRELAAADLRGDSSMVAALGERAWSQRGDTDLGGQWEKVLRAYADSSPGRNAALGALAELDATKADQFTENLYRHLSRPDDLKHGDLEALAASADKPGTGGL